MNTKVNSAQPPWRRELERALKRNRGDAHSRYFQLASVAADGSPRNRTVVFRGFGADDHALLVISDDRACKHRELLTNPDVAVAWYFTRSREQFRIVGTATVFTRDHDPLSQRAQLWSTLSDAAKAQFFWPTPGAPVPKNIGDLKSSRADADMAEPPDNFTVIAVNPKSVDHLALSNPQRRVVSDGNGAHWSSQEVNP